MTLRGRDGMGRAYMFENYVELPTSVVSANFNMVTCALQRPLSARCCERSSYYVTHEIIDTIHVTGLYCFCTSS